LTSTPWGDHSRTSRLGAASLGQNKSFERALKLIVSWIDANRASIFQKTLDIYFRFGTPGTSFAFTAADPGFLRHRVPSGADKEKAANRRPSPRSIGFDLYANEALRRDCRNANPRPTNPSSIIAQVEGSGTPGLIGTPPMARPSNAKPESNIVSVKFVTPKTTS
jgi:hypothetical protein